MANTIEEKQVLKPSIAQQRVSAPTNVEITAALESDLNVLVDAAVKPERQEQIRPDGQPLVPQKSKEYHFVKLFTPADEIRFKDGTTFTFRQIMRNDGTGFAGNSYVKTTDEKLTNNLREIAKIREYGIVEII